MPADLHAFEHAARLVLMYGLVPLWLLAGLGDWLCHRATQIERNAGVAESLLHMLMLAEVGLPLLLVLFLEVNALVIAVVLAALVVHEVTAWWDVHYASTRRHIAPVEQHMHSLLEVLPLAAASYVVVLHWDQFLALFGRGTEPARLALALKAEPLPPVYLAGLLVAVVLLAGLPYLEELWRCVRWRRREREALLAQATRAMRGGG
ncbi:diguanylate cyclase [Cupriavidus necator]|uniref:diguanylate cyclase n=1 Tax=Cupriavidus necator TaxID=106590 RepID=UPI00148FD32B|nr:diguanylate cyclase [Cupriavidus necator]NOV22619.1 diguanylate cyclase [Cupriavidus necator]